MVGAIAGYFGGFIDSLIMRICDAVLSFPSIILAMAIAAARGGPGLENAMIAVIIVLWPEYARLMRGQVLTLKQNEFVTAAESIGASQPRILFRHILPSTDAPIVVKATLDVGSAIVLTAGLSFIGIGAVPPTAEWGAMVNQGSRSRVAILVVLDLPRVGDHVGRHGPQLLRRRLARRAGSEAARGLGVRREDGETGRRRSHHRPWQWINLRIEKGRDRDIRRICLRGSGVRPIHCLGEYWLRNVRHGARRDQTTPANSARSAAGSSGGLPGISLVAVKIS